MVLEEAHARRSLREGAPSREAVEQWLVEPRLGHALGSERRASSVREPQHCAARARVHGAAPLSNFAEGAWLEQERGLR